MSTSHKDQFVLYAQAMTVLQYKEAARASQRGFARLHKKLDALKTRNQNLLDFIEVHQLTGALADFDKLERDRKRVQWEQRNV